MKPQESKAPKLFIGLGNPGLSYATTRHNVGFLMLDALQQGYDYAPFKPKFGGALTEGVIAGQPVFLFKPLSYMNRSGDPVQRVMQFYKIDLDHILVWHDDLDIAPGKVRTKKGGSSGGHNGIKSLDQHIGKEYQRLRIGIGRPAHMEPGDKGIAQYVLSPFTKAEEQWLVPLLEDTVDFASVLLTQSPERFVETINQRCLQKKG